MSHKSEIDVSLSVLCAVAKRDETLNSQEIADICGCSVSNITLITRGALAKLRGKKGFMLRDFVDFDCVVVI